MKKIEWLEDNRIKITPPRKTKKITGTRFASILGLNTWSTPFEMWLAITKTYEPPFEDTIYTIAGKTIEPKQAEYLVNSYGLNLISPENMYGKDYFNKTWGDFFPDEKHLGGMWDYLGVDEDGNVDTVFEMKTTKRAEDWGDDIPEYYALQAALYAYLLGVDDVVMVATFLEDSDYEHPEKFKVNSRNTITREFKVSERYPNFKDLVKEVETWWNEHVKTGISPVFDEKKDAELLKVLRTNTLNPKSDIESLIEEAEILKAELDTHAKEVADKEKRLKNLNEQIKKYAMDQFRDGDTKVEVTGSNYKWTLAKSETTSVDKELLEKDGILEKYITTKPSYRLTVKEVK